MNSNFSKVLSLLFFSSVLVLNGEQIEARSSETNSFLLVGQDEERGEIFLDQNSKLLWGAPILTEASYHQAKKDCRNYLKNNPKFGNLSWRLATMEEYSIASNNGLRKVIKNLNHWFWTSSVLDEYHKLNHPEVRRRWEESSKYNLNSQNYAWAFFGGTSTNEMFYPKITQLFSICVADQAEN